MHAYVEKVSDFLARVILLCMQLLCCPYELCAGQDGWICGNTFLRLVVESMYNRICHLLLNFLLTLNKQKHLFNSLFHVNRW